MKLPYNSSIQVNIINDKEMLRIGKKYKNKDYPTDVLTFNYSNEEDTNENIYGEIYVNIDAAKRQAKENNKTLEEEVAFLVQHAMLHMQEIHHEGDE